MFAKILSCVFLFSIGCQTPSDELADGTEAVQKRAIVEGGPSRHGDQQDGGPRGNDAGDFGQSGPLEGISDDGPVSTRLCNGSWISAEAVELMLDLTETTDSETIYTTYDRIDGIAFLFEECGDPWGMFPTAYRHITRRIIQAIEGREIEDAQWGRDIVLDFAGRYLENLRAALKGEQPSYAWEHYYYLADRQDVSRTRAVVVAMVAHLTLDLPYALVAIDSREDQKDDYFVLGELMIEITPDFLDDLLYYYDCDAEEILNGFFFGDWIDGAFGADTTITLSYQTIRTKSWNNRWYLEQSWGEWVASSEIYTSFWAIDGVLAGLDASGAI